MYCCNVFVCRGSDFRTTFSRLGGLRALTTAPIVALTASAPPEIEATIISSLYLREPIVVTRQLDRPNIYISTCKSVGLKVNLYTVQQLCHLLKVFASLFMQRDLGQLAQLLVQMTLH